MEGKNIVPDCLNPKAEVWCLEVEDDHSLFWKEEFQQVTVVFSMSQR